MSKNSVAKNRCRARAGALLLAILGFPLFVLLTWNLYVYGSLVALTGVIFRLRNQNSDRGQVAGSSTMQAVVGEDRVIGYVLGIIGAVVLFGHWYFTRMP